MSDLFSAYCAVVSVLCIALIVSILVINEIHSKECKQLIFPGVSQLNASFNDLKYKTEADRFVAESIAQYEIDQATNRASPTTFDKIKAMDASQMTDFAVYKIVNQDLEKSLDMMTVYNNKKLESLYNTFNYKKMSFPPASRSNLINILLNRYDSLSERVAYLEKLKGKTDKEIFIIAFG